LLEGRSILGLVWAVCAETQAGPTLNAAKIAKEILGPMEKHSSSRSNAARMILP